MLSYYTKLGHGKSKMGTVTPRAVIEKNHTKGRAKKPIKEIKQKHKK